MRPHGKTQVEGQLKDGRLRTSSGASAFLFVWSASCSCIQLPQNPSPTSRCRPNPRSPEVGDSAGLKLPPCVLAKIFDGAITTWDHQEISSVVDGSGWSASVENGKRCRGAFSRSVHRRREPQAGERRNGAERSHCEGGEEGDSAGTAEKTKRAEKTKTMGEGSFSMFF